MSTMMIKKIKNKKIIHFTIVLNLTYNDNQPKHKQHNQVRDSDASHHI